MCRPPPSGPIFNSRSSVRAHFRRGRKRDRVGGKSRSDMLRAETPSPWMPRSRPDRGDVPGAKGEESTAPANTRNARWRANSSRLFLGLRLSLAGGQYSLSLSLSLALALALYASPELGTPAQPPAFLPTYPRTRFIGRRAIERPIDRR
jgi:hypothetical protein